MSLLSESRVPDPYDAPALNWGVMAPGGIAHAMALAMQRSRQRLVAVGSRSIQRAQAYAERFGLSSAYDSYEAVAADPDVQAVYVASPHSEHRDQALLAIEAGKHVLVEKAFTQNAAQAREVFAAAEAAGVVCLEAMWPRFAPRYDVVRQILRQGLLGEIVSVRADHSQRLPEDPQRRLYNPDLAGGALLDLGIYPVSFASFALGGAPSELDARGSFTKTGVDRTVAMLASGYPDFPDATVTLTFSLAARGSVSAEIIGTDARLELDQTSFYAPGPVRVVRPNGSSVEAPASEVAGSDALVYEACHLARLVAEGRTESDLLPAAETVSIMDTLDEVRRQIGLRYPGEAS